MHLYQYPEVYAALRAPDPELLHGARLVFRQHLDRPPKSIMDPACGPANWLVPFAKDAVFVAGNDLSHEMIGTARKELNGYPCELVRGDMRELKFASAPFDVSLELAGTASQLDPEDFIRHLRSVHSQLRAGGLVLVTLFFETDSGPEITYQSGPIPITTGGEAWVTYEILAFDAANRAEAMRRIVRTSGVPNVPLFMEDHYTVRVWQEDAAREAIIAAGGFDILTMDGIPAADDKGERVVVLRRR